MFRTGITLVAMLSSFGALAAQDSNATDNAASSLGTSEKWGLITRTDLSWAEFSLNTTDGVRPGTLVWVYRPDVSGFKRMIGTMLTKLVDSRQAVGQADRFTPIKGDLVLFNKPVSAPVRVPQNRLIETAATSLVLSALTDVPVGTAQPRTAPDDLNSVIERAKDANESVGAWLTKVRQSHSEVKDLIEKYEVGDTKTETFIIGKVRDQVQHLERAADALLKRGPSFAKDIDLYDAALQAAEKAYAELATKYQHKATQTPNPRNQKLYRQMSDAASATASMMASNRKGIEGTRANAKKLLSEVAESRVVLHDLSEFLGLRSDVDKLAASIEEFYSDLQAYNKELDQTVQQINNWIQRQQNTSGDAPPANGVTPDNNRGGTLSRPTRGPV